MAPKEIGDYWSERITRMLRQCATDRDSLPDSQCIDLLFEDITGDVLGAVERIYELANFPMPADVRAAMQQYLAENPRGKHGQIVYDLEGDFGINRDSLRESLGFYYQRFPVSIEA